MMDFTTLVVALYTISFVRSSGIVLVGSTFFTANFSSLDCGVVQRSMEELLDLIMPPPPPPPDPACCCLLAELYGGGRAKLAPVLAGTPGETANELGGSIPFSTLFFSAIEAQDFTFTPPKS
uniref:Uncharacterized protein n=1 Tax=Anopheles culicifacies TaxID=139723 RepID=A0A182M477_9DIPT